jgi:hypothetical protein
MGVCSCSQNHQVMKPFPLSLGTGIAIQGRPCFGLSSFQSFLLVAALLIFLKHCLHMFTLLLSTLCVFPELLSNR